jgi:hypothetical protein
MTTDNPFSMQDRVIVTVHDWQKGELEFAGTVTAILSAAYCRVLVDGDNNLVYAVNVADMRLTSEPAANARRAA